MKRVVVTGAGAISALGNDWTTVRERLASGRNAVVRMPEWADIKGLNTQLAAPVPPFALPAHYTRKATRSMGRVALIAVLASEAALADAGLTGHPIITGGRMGIAYGSSTGTPSAIQDFGRMMTERTTEDISATTYIRMMPHTTAVNIGVFFGITGRILTTSSACTSGSQGIGYVNAHGTATDHGDVAESHATHAVLGGAVPVSSLKSYLGHTLGACGALEAWMTIEMMRDSWFAPTVNLVNPDPRCAPLDYIMGEGRRFDTEYVMSNNFAFGGINTSLVFRRWDA